jgi:hypothetical protein
MKSNKAVISASASQNRMDRRQAIKWVLTAAAAVSVTSADSLGFGAPAMAAAAAAGYGTDPKLNEVYKAGDLWPLTFNKKQRLAAAALCDVIIPADERSPSASQLNVHDFIDEWISAPYPRQRKERKVVLDGLAWLDTESRQRFKKSFAELSNSEQNAICDDICYRPKAKPKLAQAADFFSTFRNLASSGFYTTPEGMKDLQYLGNVALAKFDGPPPEVLKHLNLL